MDAGVQEAVEVTTLSPICHRTPGDTGRSRGGSVASAGTEATAGHPAIGHQSSREEGVSGSRWHLGGAKGKSDGDSVLKVTCLVQGLVSSRAGGGSHAPPPDSCPPGPALRTGSCKAEAHACFFLPRLYEIRLRPLSSPLGTSGGLSAQPPPPPPLPPASHPGGTPSDSQKPARPRGLDFIVACGWASAAGPALGLGGQRWWGVGMWCLGLSFL